MTQPVKLVIAGAGCRGTGYALFAEQHPDLAQIVGVAEPREFYRRQIAEKHHIPPEHCFNLWEDMVKVPKFADAVLICTQDHQHEAPAIAFAELGYNIMLEKPMAVSAEACRRIVKAVKKANVAFAVCHVLRYTLYSQELKRILKSGKIGDIVSIQHLEPVAHWHQAHSFVRGNWRNEVESSPMLLAKCCHDVDWLRYMMDKPCSKIQSFGSLRHLTKACQPKGAADRCTDCPPEIESGCPYSALKIYLRDRVARGLLQWPTDVLTPVVTPQSVADALRNGPYGRCVYACDNDVVDHQVVNMEFSDSTTAAMTMTAFCDEGARQTRIFGSRGSIRTDSRFIHVTDFLTGETETVDTNLLNDGGILSGHGGGDMALMAAFVKTLATGDRSYILSGVDETLESHLMVFAAEESRKAGKVVDVTA